MADITLNQSDIERGEGLLLSLIYPITAEDMTEGQAEEFARAAVEQAEYSLSSASRPVKSESVGDMSVTYADADIRAVNMHGERISPTAVARLQRSGLLCRWI